MAQGATLVPGGRGWLVVAGSVLTMAAGSVGLGLLVLAGSGPHPGAVVLVGIGALAGAGAVASIVGSLRVEARHLAVAVLRPDDDVVEVSLGDGWPDALRAVGVDPGPVGVAPLRHVTAAVGDGGVGLWRGGGTPSLAGFVPWSAVSGVSAGATTTVKGGSQAAVALAVPRGPLLVVPRRGASGNLWAAPDDVASLAARWAAGAWGTGALVPPWEPTQPEEVAPPDDQEADGSPWVAPPDVAAPPSGSGRRDPAHGEAARDREPSGRADDAASPPTPSAGESVEERIRRLTGR